MTTFVLVHGAWHGGWCWRFVAPELRRAGHEVYSPSLTGRGDRVHLARTDIDLDLHVKDVVTLLEMEDLHEVVLLGHSYGGMVVTGVADHSASRIGRLVCLDAFVPENGRSALDYVVPERAEAFRKEGERTGWISPPPLSLWGITQPVHIAFEQPRETRHPFRCFAQPIRLTNEAALARLHKTFIYCSSPATGTFDQFARKYRNDPSWLFFELKTGHDAMILVPDELIAIMLQSA